MKLEKSRKFRGASHVIFDLDGTLLDTEKLYRRALFHVAEEYDKECSNDVVLKIAGTPQSITAKIAREEMELPICSETFLQKYNGFIHEILGDCNLMPGAEKIIKHFHQHRIPMAVATSSSSKAVQVKTRKHKTLFKLMEHFVCGDSDPEVRVGKPAPDIFLVCASRFSTKPQPSECLVFEDSLNGVKAGMSAGMQVVMVPESHVPLEYGEHATLRIESFHHLEPEHFGLPSLNDKEKELCDVFFDNNLMHLHCCKRPLKHSPVTHVIFDLDGTIVDSENVYCKALKDAVKSYGGDFYESFINEVKGSVEQDVAKTAVERFNLDVTPEEFVKTYNQFSKVFLGDLDLMPGAERLIRHLHKNDIPLAVATSSNQSAFDLKTNKYAELFSVFHHIVCGGTDPEVKQGKPAPDIFLLAASRFENPPDPTKCLVFEDSKNGMLAGRAAEMQVVMIPDVDVPYEVWKLATLRVDSLNYVMPELFGLPPFADEEISPEFAAIKGSIIEIPILTGLNEEPMRVNKKESRKMVSIHNDNPEISEEQIVAAVNLAEEKKEIPNSQ